MTTYLVPCGVSVHKGITDPRRKRPAGANPGAFIETERTWRPRALLGSELNVLESWWRTLASVAGRARLAEWDTDVCAETNTIAKRTKIRRLARLLDQTENRVVLLASDTDDGVAAALCVAYIIAGGARAKVGYLASPSDDSEACGLADRLISGKVTITRIRGLKPTARGLSDASRGIGWALRAGLALDGSLEVHLTGGYKATLLHLLTMTELAHSLDPGRVTAWYIFDDDNAAVVPIEMRTLTKEYCDDMREELSKVLHKDPLRPPYSFEGMGWLMYPAGPQLTSFGVGYLAVLGDIPVPGTADGGRW